MRAAARSARASPPACVATLSAARDPPAHLLNAVRTAQELGGQEEEKIGLVRTHAYAVLQVRELFGQRLLQLKNPWAKVRWKGAYSVHDTKRWTAELRKALAYDQVRLPRHMPRHMPRHPPHGSLTSLRSRA